MRASCRIMAHGMLVPRNDESLQFRSTMQAKLDGTLDFVQDNYNLLPIETKYYRLCISEDEMREENLPVDGGFTLVGFEPIITSQYVHHYMLYGSSDDRCGYQRTSSLDQLYSWSPGKCSYQMALRLYLAVQEDAARASNSPPFIPFCHCSTR
jgi:hypothetical protein